MKKYLILLVPLLFLMAQCQKDSSYLGDRTIAEGIITEKGSGKPVANVQMRLRRCTYQVFGSSSCETIDTIRTDTKGFFSFNFQHEKAYEYEIRAVPNAEKYYVVDNDAPVEKGRYSNKINLLLTPYTILKLRIKNSNPNDNTDAIFISPPTGHYIPDIYGTSVDTTIIGKMAGSQTQKLNWWVTKKGVKTNFSDSFFCPPHDTVTYQINY